MARHLDAPVEYRFAAPFAPDQQERFRRLNPNLSLPILVEGGNALWEADAIACRLSQMVGSDFWRSGDGLPDMIRWLSWAGWNFVRACDMVHFERVTKRRYDLGPTRQDVVDDGLAKLAAAAPILDAHLDGRQWLVGDSVSYADFRMACVMPFQGLAGLPLAQYRNIAAWNARLEEIEAWRSPFAGLDAPELPPVKP